MDLVNILTRGFNTLAKHYWWWI